MGYLQDRWRAAMTPADTREIWDWVTQELELPPVYAVSGRFDIDTCPMLKGPLRALRNPIVRKVTCMCGVQCLKTLVGELWLCWLIANDPGPTQWLHPDDEEATEHAKERFIPLLENAHVINKYFTDRAQDRTTSFIKFRHQMYLRMEGALNRGNTQRKSIKNQMRSEVWQSDKWIPGRLKEADGRKTQFTHNSKTYTESQPGWHMKERKDEMHGEYMKGNQNQLHFACDSCRKMQPFWWDFRRHDGTRAGMRWDTTERTRRPNGEWRWGELRQTIRYECIYCGHRHYDDPLVRGRMVASYEHVPQNPDADPTHESFTWGQLAMPTLSWYETEIGGVKNFLIAHQKARIGSDKELRDFWMKVPPEPYDPSKHSALADMETIELSLNAAPASAAAIVYENITFTWRLMAVDVQADHFWVLVEIWSDHGDSLTLHFGKVYAWDDVEALQQQWHVLHEDVMVDVSHRRHEVKVECSRRGRWVEIQQRKRWVCWKALEGSDHETFIWNRKLKGGKIQRIQLPYSHPPQIGDPCAGLPANDPRRREFLGKACMVIAWSNPTIKDIVMARVSGRVEGMQNLVHRGPWNDEFNRQIHSQRKEHAEGNYGGGRWKWVKVHDDHGLDCKCMVTTRAFMRGLIIPDPLGEKDGENEAAALTAAAEGNGPTP